MSADTEAIRAEARERVVTEALALGNALEHAVNQALEIDRLASLVEKLRPYLTHRDYCEDGAICVCGLADLRPRWRTSEHRTPASDLRRVPGPASRGPVAARGANQLRPEGSIPRTDARGYLQPRPRG